MARYEKYGWDEVSYDQKLDKFVPTLYIGLGGTGKDVLMRFRKRLYDRFGACREGFATFLAIDTDDQSDIPRGEKTADFAAVKYERDEFIKCTIDHATFKSIVNRVQTRGDRRYVNWLHPEIDTKISAGSLQTGAGTHRQIGRLAFFNNYSGIRGAIHTAFKSMMAFAAEKPSSFFDGIEGQVYTDRLEVVIVTSLAGGTGSGMFIDIAYLVRDILTDPDLAKKVKAPHTTVMAILPTIFANSDPNLAGRFRQNAYASLLEMEYYNTPRPEENPFKSEEELEKSGEFKAVEFVVNWDDDRSREKAIRHHAWDTCYLIDDVNDPQLVAQREHADVYQMIADYLFLDFGASNFAVAKRSARSNHTQLKERILAAQVLDDEDDHKFLTDEEQERGADVLYESKYGCGYNSFGLSEIYIDKEGVNRSASYRLALEMVLRRWLGDPEQFTDATYNKWIKEDLFSGAPPVGETEAISFHPDDMWKTLLLDRDQNRDWLTVMENHFDQIDRMDGVDGPAKLQSALATHREALSSATRADGTLGAARQTLDTRLGELSGTPTKLGKMRTRLQQLARQRFNRIGVLPTLKLLEYYHKAFRLAAERARKQQKMSVPRDEEILARLRDADKVPFPCKNIAKRIEFTRACKKARGAVQQRYEIEAATNLESLANTLRVYVGEPDQDPNAMPIHRSLYGEYQSIREFLEQLAGYLNKRFNETRRAKRSDRREPLLPEWTDDQYDQEINKALLYVGSTKGEDEFDWDAVEKAFLGEAKVTSCAELIDNSVEAFNTNQSALDEVAERIAHACRTVLGNRIDLTEFKNGNVVDYLTSMKDRTPLLERLVGASAPYMPSIPPQDRHSISPAYRNLLGRAAGTGQSGPEFTQKLDSEIQKIANSMTQRDGEDVRFAEIHSKEEGDPSSLVFVREMGGVPIHFYGRLAALNSAYFDNDNREYRKTCHIRFRESWRNLPDIETIEDGDYQKIQRCVEDVLRALLLNMITFDGDTFVVKVPLEGDFGTQTTRLGTRVSRIIKHACERDDIRRYMHMRWSVWKNKATAKDMAVMYNAIQHTQLLFPSVVTAGDKERIPPIRNCFRKLLLATGDDLEKLGGEGAAWLDLLRPRYEGVDSDYDTWKPRYVRTAELIRDTCLTRVPCDNLPIYQIDERKVSQIKFPDSTAVGTEDRPDEQKMADAPGK